MSIENEKETNKGGDSTSDDNNDVSSNKQEANFSTDKSVKEVLKEMGLERFNSVEGLAKSYKELNKQYSQRKVLKNDSGDEDLLNFNKESFKDMTGDSELENETLKNLSKALREKTGLPSRLTDFSAVEINKAIQENIKNSRKAEAEEYMKNTEIKESVSNFLGSQSEEYRNTVQKRMDEGELSKSELDLMAVLGKEVPEATSGVETQVVTTDIDGMSAADMDKEHAKILKTQAEALYNKSHPSHAQVKARFDKLENKLGY